MKRKIGDAEIKRDKEEGKRAAEKNKEEMPPLIIG